MMMNHDSIEISDRIFGFSTPAQKEFNAAFRENAFAIAAKHSVDLLFTYVCAFDVPQEREYLTKLADLFVSSGGNFYFVELSADIGTRLERNRTPHRLERKPSKRDIQWSERNLLRDTKKYQLNSDSNEFWFENHLKIDNTDLDADTVADMVIQTFGLSPNEKDEKEYRYGV